MAGPGWSDATRRVALALIVVACAMRFVGLETSPPGFFFDEAMGAAHSVCYQQTGRDLFGTIGMFARVDNDVYQSGPFVVGGALWTAAFGSGAFGFRSFVAFVGVMTVLGLYRLVRAVGADEEMAVWTALFAACLPWAFLFSRISWDAPLATALLIWGLSLVYTRDHRVWPFVGAALIALASYVYTPMRIQAALMVALLPGVKLRKKAGLVAVLAVLTLPVLAYYSDPAFGTRSRMLILTSSDPLNPYRDANSLGLAWGFVQQLAAHFSPRFLLLSGDRNLRHSIQTFGMLDAVTALGVVISVVWLVRALVRRTALNDPERTIVLLSVLGVVAGVVPSALTWSAVPHGVRALGAWPFFASLAGFGWTRAFIPWPGVRIVVVGASAVLFAAYLTSLFRQYPQASASYFDSAQVRRIQETRTFPDYYGPVSRAYYRMTAFGERCEDVRKSLTPENAGR